MPFIFPLVPSLALFLHVGFTAPAELYLGNTLVLEGTNLLSVLKEALPLATVVSALLLMAMLVRGLARLSGWIAVFAIAGFNSQLFLNPEASSGWMAAEAAIFILGAALAYRMPTSAWRWMVGAAAFVVVTNTIILLPQAWPHFVVQSASATERQDNPFDRSFTKFPQERFFGTFPAGAGGLNSYSPEENVVVILIDTLQGDVAEKIIDPSRFDGFTLYRNAAGVHPYTAMSLPVIHSGEVYSPGERIADYFKRADEQRVERVLLSRGFGVDHLGLWSRAAFTYGPEASRALASSALNAVFWQRQVPSITRLSWRGEATARWTGAKGALQPEDHTAMDIDTFRILVNGIRVNAREPRFKWMHFWGAHPPATLDASCEPIETAFTNDSFVAQAQCMVSQVTAYFDALKRAKIYEKTQIFVLSDHGTKKIAVNGDETDNPVPWTARSAGHPTVLFKDFGETGPMRFSDAPVSQIDIKTTILGQGGLKSPPSRERIFMDYKLASEVNAEQLHPTVYQIGADVRSPSDWLPLD